jgi:hypothetical protein
LSGSYTSICSRRRIWGGANERRWPAGKDAPAHITHWKADAARASRKQRRPAEERGLKYNDENRLIYMRWRDRPPQEVLAWHRQLQEDVLVALREAPEEWFSGKERKPIWPYDLDGHSSYHRVRDIEEALRGRAAAE